MKNSIIQLYSILVRFGFDPRSMLRSLRGLPRYLRDLSHFRATHIGRIEFNPCFNDWYEEAGSTKSEYFWQDLLVARMICEAKPEKHVDIGSRIDGFVAHVSSFREIEVLDVRPVTTRIPGVIFKQADLMNPIQEMESYCDSLSCLHALEHFGLGRYGDPIDPLGHEKGIANMAGLLKPGGSFYLSTPIGIERVEFNANRVFDPRSIISLAEANGLTLKTLTVVSDRGLVNEVSSDVDQLFTFAEASYNLGIFTFVKR
jgi:SAM-dependent methyltransferase